MFPQSIINSVPKEEKILFKSKKIINKRQVYIMGVSMLVMFYSLIIFLFFITGINFFSSTNLFSIFLDIFLLAIPIIGGYFIARGFLHKTFFLITDKKLYILSKTSPQAAQTIETILIKSIISYGLQKRIFDSRDRGTITFVSDGTLTKIKNVPEFTHFQNVVESILYNYGDIDSKLKILKEKNDIEFPLTLNVSKERVDLIKKSIKLNFLALILIPILTPIIIFLAIIILSIPYLNFMLTIIGPIFGCLFMAVPIINIITMRKRQSDLNQNLVIENNEVYTENLPKNQISLDSNTSINFLKTYKPGRYLTAWDETVDTIEIKPKFNSNEKIVFGPVDGLTERYEILFSHLIKWKGDHDILLKKNQLEEPDKSIPLLVKEKRGLIPKLPQKIQLVKSEIPNEIREKIENYLNPNEEIKIYFKPNPQLYKNYIFIALCTIIIILDLIFFIPLVQWDEFLGIASFMLIITIVSTICIFNGLCYISGKLMMRKSMYVFTNQKIIFYFKRKFCLVTYKNIHSIGFHKKRFSVKYQVIVLNLKTPVENNPFINKSVVFIHRVPVGYDLINEINRLKESP